MHFLKIWDWNDPMQIRFLLSQIRANRKPIVYWHANNPNKPRCSSAEQEWTFQLRFAIAARHRHTINPNLHRLISGKCILKLGYQQWSIQLGMFPKSLAKVNVFSREMTIMVWCCAKTFSVIATACCCFQCLEYNNSLCNLNIFFTRS